MSGVGFFSRHTPLVKICSRSLLRIGATCGPRITVQGYHDDTSAASQEKFPQPYRKTVGALPDAHYRVKFRSAGDTWRKPEVPSSLVDSEGKITLDPILLRDSCTCAKCVDVSTRQREFTFSDIPPDIEAIPLRQQTNRTWEVEWRNDIPGFKYHVSTFSPKDVKSLRTQKKQLSTLVGLQRSWTKDDYLPERNTFMFDGYMQSDKTLFEALRSLNHTGLVFIHGVPAEAGSVASIAERIGPLRTTFYGPTWDVRTVLDSKNVAYTSKHLGFHMDLLYMDQPPSYQLLHCIQNSCAGGESRFVDTYKALDLLAESYPGFVDALTSSKVTFHYDNDGHYYRRTTKILEQRPQPMPGDRFTGVQNNLLFQRLVSINWSPPFMAGLDPYTVPEKRRDFLKAAKAFADMLDSSELVYETKMEEGTCVIFDNQRVCHARNAFDVQEGQRWLRGAYLDRCDFISRHITMRAAMRARDNGVDSDQADQA